LHYQPLIDWPRRAVCGMEALVRWNDPERGLVEPVEFIPIAEETGLIVPIGEWVLSAALEQNRAWQQAGRPQLPISVNLSARQFRQKDLVDTLRRILADTGQPARLLELEITETTLMQDIDETRARLQEISAMGVQLVIDDFGIGYSSLSYLKRFPRAQAENRPDVCPRSQFRSGRCRHRLRHHRPGRKPRAGDAGRGRGNSRTA
jgi:EAL domain-containing protein (putative c-di-GMP-specific phosphodiesterase class I)